MAKSNTKTQLRKAIEVVIQSGSAILVEVDGLNEHAFWGDGEKQISVENHFITIADTLRQLQAVAPNLVDTFSDAETAIRFGEVIRQQSGNLDYGTVWRAIKYDLPALIREADDIRQSI